MPVDAKRPPPKCRRVLLGIAVLVVCAAGFVGWATRETGAERARRLLAEARITHLAGKNAEAEDLARSALESDPSLSEAALIAARCAVARKDFARAIEYANKAESGPSDTRVSALLLTADLNHHRLGRLSQAEEDYRAALAIDRDNLLANRGLADLLGLCGRGREAVPFVLRTVKLDQPTNQLLLIARPSGAVNDPRTLEKAAAMSPHDVNALVGLAWHAASNEQNEKAVPLLQKALDIAPDHAGAYVALGRQYLTLARFDALAAWAENTVPGAEKFGETWLIRGRLAEHRGNLEGAVRCYWEAVRLAPESKAANFHLSKLLAATNQPVRAEPFLRRIRQLERLRAVQDRVFSRGPTPGLLLELAKAYEDAGRIWEAYGWSLLARQQNAGFPELANYVEAIRSKTRHLPLRLTADAANPAIAVDLSSYPVPTFQPPPQSPAAEPLGNVPAVTFRDDAASAGLRFEYHNGSPETPRRRMFELTGGGIGVLDFDRDGFPDVCFSQGGRWPPGLDNGGDHDRLFQNLSGDRFRDATISAGLAETSFGQGIAVGDYDSDGFPDLYVANIGANRLWINNGDGTFADGTSAAGLAGNEWTTSCLMADLNADGFPDIYDVNYLKGDDLFDRVCQHADRSPALCMPFDFEGEADRLWLSIGDGRFSDATSECLSVRPNGKGLGVVAWDVQGAGRLSLLIANDTTPNFFFAPKPENEKNFLLEERGILSGLAFNGNGKAEGCMGIAVGDVDGDGRLDVHITNFLAESNTLWLQRSPGLFEDATQTAGLRTPTLGALGFGTQFLDADRDGRLDLFVANGHIDDLRAFGRPYEMAPQFFQWNGASFTEANPETLGPYFQKTWLGRAAARLDWNRDGRADLFVGHLGRPSALLTNTTRAGGRFLSLKLVGVGSNRDAVGTTARARIGQKRFVHQLVGGGGYQASNQQELLLGTGEARQVDELKIRWPSGREQTFEHIPADQHLLLIEGADRLLPIE